MTPYYPAHETIIDCQATIRAYCAEPLEYLRTAESSRRIVALSHARMLVASEDPKAWDAAYEAHEAAFRERMDTPGLSVLDALFGES